MLCARRQPVEPCPLQLLAGGESSDAPLFGRMQRRIAPLPLPAG